MTHLEEVILVDERDAVIGTMEKLEAHRLGLLHRAFSVFVFNDAGELLLHRRADSKYHSGGLWTNTCCSHPRMGESVVEAAHRRLHEEMGFDCDVTPVFSFLYKAPLGDLIEHELDHVLIGTWNGTPTPDPAEVSDWKYMRVEDILTDMEAHPAHYTAWFRICFESVIEAINRPISA